MSFFNCDGIKIYYETVGEGPTLLLINGITADTRQWEPLIQHLKNSFKVISYDMRCAGKSDKPKASITVPQLSQETLHLAQYLGDEKFNVMGFSMGGIVAQDLALSYPNVIDKLVLLSTAPSLKRPYPLTNEANSVMHAQEFSVELLQKVFQLIFGPRYKKKISVEEYIKMRVEDENPQPAEAYWNQLQAAEKHDLVEKVGGIRCPTLVLTGDCDDLIRTENSKWLSEHIPNAKLHAFKGVGHMVPLECPKQLADCLKDFLK